MFYFLYNNFMDLLSALKKSAYLYVSELDSRATDNNEANIIVFYFSIGCVLISVVALIPVVYIVNQLKKRYLEVLLEMDNNNIRKLANKCEKFMNMLSDEGNEEIDSNDEDLEELARIEAEDEYSMSKRSKKKKAKNTIKNKRMFVIKFIIGMLAIEVYFFANYFMQDAFLKTCQVVNKELNMTGSIEPYFWFSLNAQRELLNDPQRPVINKNSFTVARDAITEVQRMNSMMQ